MKISKCSASSINTHSHCAFKYFLGYILKMESPSGKAALQGKIVHQVFEWMSLLKKRGKINVDPMWLLNRAWDKHISENKHIEIKRTTSRGEAADFKKCRIAIEHILDDNYYNPYRLKIIDAEKRFEIEIPGNEWEVVNENGDKGQFTVRGFIDLVHEIDENTIEIIDWKTGKRVDFYTRKEKDLYQLMKDIQPRIYHLASSELYKQYQNVLLTFYYIEDGGPITISLGLEDLAATLAAIWQFLQRIRHGSLITRNRRWQCKMCAFERSGICQKVWSDLHTMGGEYVENKYSELTFDQQKTIGK